jgi:hypothetical protein
MADQEFERLVQEGLEALKRSRERLKAAWDKPKDWEGITPEPVKSAVKHICSQFKTFLWQFGEQTECACYISLHLELATSPQYKGRPNLIRSDLRDTWHLEFEGMNEAERFAHWIEEYASTLKKNIAAPFNALLKIGLANESSLEMTAVDWARTVTRGLLYSLKWTTPHLIKRMCDEQEDKLEINTKNFDAHCCWVYWRAPFFIHMKPSGNTPYVASAAWQRHEDAETTESILRGLTDKMLDPAWFELDRLAGQAHVAVASQPSLDVWSPPTESAGHATAVVDELGVSTNGSPGINGDKSPRNETAATTLSTAADPAVVGIQAEIEQARERMRHFEAEIAAVDTKLAAFQQSLVEIIVRGTSSFKPGQIDKAIRKLHADKKELEFRMGDWQINLNRAQDRLQMMENQRSAASGTYADRPENGSGEQVDGLQADNGKPGTSTTPKEKPIAYAQGVQNLNYQSAIKRGIAWVITADPKASDLAICRRFDEEGIVELPKHWKTGQNRSFERAYRDPIKRDKIEKLISRVRSDMRKKGLLN